MQENNLSLARKPDDREPDRRGVVRAFAEAEAGLRLKGMKPTLIFYELKNRIMAGEIDFDQAVEILIAIYPSNPPDEEDWEDLCDCDPLAYCKFMKSRDPTLQRLIQTNPGAYYQRLAELETPENFVALFQLYQGAIRQSAELGRI